MMTNKIKVLQAARHALSQRYKTEHQTKDLSPAERHVYIQARMPATQAVCANILASHLGSRADLNSLLDLGCGPGSATAAALQVLPNLQTIHLIDQDDGYPYNFVQHTHFMRQDFKQLSLPQSYDLTIISYALSECSESLLIAVLEQAWANTEKYLVLIEPGTPYGYASFMLARQHLINQGAKIIAPCPHENICPLSQGDWCHFKLRLARSKLHQQIKQGSQAFEDESYTFGIFSKSIVEQRHKRIIKKPMHKTGHMIFDLCTTIGLERIIVSRKNKTNYQRAKKLDWGDNLDL